MYLFWRRWLNRRVLSSKQRVGKRSRPRCYRPRIERFEDRVVLSTIHWINPNSGNWEVGSNWSGGAVPGPGDDVIIDVPGNITVTHGSGKDSVQSLTSQQNLALTDGSSLTVTGAFSESANHLLDADQASTLLANGTSTINGASLYAANGSTISLPGATSYDALGAGFSPTLQASGAGSRLDLSHVTTWRGAGDSGNGNRIYVQALGGGVVDLSQLPQIAVGNTWFQAYDGGQISLTQLTNFTGALPGGYNVLDVRRGGSAIMAPNLTSLTNVDLDLGGNATLPVAGLSSFNHGNLYAFNDGNIGGVLALPLTTIDLASSNFSPTFQASGVGSRLDLSHVTTWRGAGDSGNGNRIYVQALGGGVVDLSQLPQIAVGNTWFQAYDGGQISLTQLTNFTGALPGGYNILDVRRGGAISLSSGTTGVSNVIVSVDPTSTITAGTLHLASASLLTGSGTITANVINDAEVQPDLATDTLVVTGDYTQNPAGTVTHMGTLTVDGLFTWAGGTITGSGTVNASGGLSISGDSNKTLDGRTLNDSGSGTWTGTGNLIIGDGAILYLFNAAALDIQNDQTITNTLGGSATVDNTGLLRKSGGTGTTTIGVPFTNTGTVQVVNGTLRLTGPFSNFSGSTLTGGVYLIGGTFQFPGAAITTNLATILLNGPSAQIVDASGNDALVNFTSNGGNFTIENSRNFTSAGFNDSGSLTIGPGSTFTVNGTYTETGTLSVQLGGTMTVAGSFSDFSGGTLAGGTYLIGGTFQFPGANIVSNDANLVLTGPASQIVDQANNDALANFAGIDATGSFTIQNGRNFTTAGAFSNAGSLIIGLGSTLTVTGAFTQTGTLSIQDLGILDLLGGGSANASLTSAGTLVIDAGSMFTLTLPVTLTGTVNVQPGATLSLPGDSTNQGSLYVLGVVTVIGDFSNNGSVQLLAGGTFTVIGAYTQNGGSTSLSNATLSATGLVNLAGGVLSGSGTINASVLNAALIELGSGDAAGLLTITGDYTQTATGILSLTIGGYRAGVDFGQLAIGGTATLGGMLDVSLANGFTPMSGDSFVVLTFASLSGGFATTNLDPSLQTPPTYDATDVMIQAN
ncbi:MAG TPA: hypothetical protein VKU02_20900 [Gemmataceae bacterium]|nr:hypothetical protein [Gemmataceae bacterium]